MGKTGNLEIAEDNHKIKSCSNNTKLVYFGKNLLILKVLKTIATS
jgi:hypothetical protein